MKIIIQEFIAKFYQVIILVLLAIILILSIFGGIQTWRASLLKTDYQLLDAQYKKEVAEVKALTEQAKAEARTKEKEWSDQLLEAEKNHNAKMQEIITDVNNAKSAVNSMSKQLDTATRRMSTASKETIIEYANTNSDILKECIGRYQWVAEQADKHAVDAKRLSDAWPE
jgi:outer membrane murein-binding lipoprotein Lpp